MPTTTPTVTRAQFLAAFRTAFVAQGSALSKDTDALELFMEFVKATVQGGFGCRLDGPAFKAAWKACGIKSKLTYKALHALTPDAPAPARAAYGAPK